MAPMPGTTLGLINVPGLPLGPKQRAFDTPGVPHPYQLTAQLNMEEVKLVGGAAPCDCEHVTVGGAAYWAKGL